jgi:predicted CXXCH cytochrome family protein
MKKLGLLFLFVGIVSFSFGQSVVGTPHDFGAQTFNASSFTNDACFVCHAPHGNVNAAGSLLWNQTETVQAFTMYSNTATIQGTIDAAPDGTSKLCLSCHDDQTAIGTGGTLSTEYPATTAAMGTDLTNDHPIGITYEDGLDAGLHPAAGLAGVALFNNKVECASCHDAHNNSNTMFLRISNNASALCLECHNK